MTEVPQGISVVAHAFRMLSERIRTMPHPHRQEKLGELIAAELSELLRTRVKDPRVGFASITHVEVSGDLRHAKVFVSVMGSEEERAETMKGLKNATGFLRHELATRLVLRYMPELNFKLDNSIEEGARILALINQVEQEESTKTGSAESE
jgi:ribosome-binding factor A